MAKNWRGRSVAVVYAVLLTAAIVLLIVFGRPKSVEAQKIGFVMMGSAADERNAANCDGIRAACRELGVELLLRDQVSEGSGACPRAVAGLAQEGAEMIILSSPDYSREMKELFPRYPQISFYGIFADQGIENLTAYSTRMYQARYLSGIVAGAQTESGKIGFVSTTPSCEVLRGVNAFALGVRRVRPDAEVIVAWTGSLDSEALERWAANALIRNEGVDVITHHQDQSAVIDAAEAAGVASIGYYNALEGRSDRYLTCAACDWELLYTELIREYLRGQSGGMVNNWLGLESGVVGLSEYSPLVSRAAADEVEAARKEIVEGLDVFTNEIYDNQGTLRCGPGEAMSDESLLLRLDWLVEGVRVYE